jgi:hypothetical protein
MGGRLLRQRVPIGGRLLAPMAHKEVVLAAQAVTHITARSKHPVALVRYDQKIATLARLTLLVKAIAQPSADMQGELQWIPGGHPPDMDAMRKGVCSAQN